jgi:hypothetical protein
MIEGAASPAPAPVALYLPRISVGFAVLAFISGLVYNRRTKTPESLEGHVVRVVAASTIPTAIVLIYSGYDPDVLAQLTGFINVSLTLAGLALLYISAKAVLTFK